ncbi:hypothetical protein C0991_002309, partial [Blastosporella zonata]
MCSPSPPAEPSRTPKRKRPVSEEEDNIVEIAPPPEKTGRRKPNRKTIKLEPYLLHLAPAGKAYG